MRNASWIIGAVLGAVALVTARAPNGFAAGSISEDCSKYTGDCSYYLCREAQDRCGADGYLIDFGYRYCSAYKEATPEFSAKAQPWLSQIRACLQEELEDALSRKTMSCRETEQFAVRSHFTCYHRYDFCGLPAEDKARLLWIAKAQLKDPAFYLNLAGIASHCVQ